MKTRRIALLIVGVMFGAVLVGASLTKVVQQTSTNALATEQVVQAQPQYKNLSEKLLADFRIIRQTYTPEVLQARCLADSTWTQAGMVRAEKAGLVFLCVQMPNGLMGFGYTQADYPYPVCTMWVPFNQPHEGQPLKEAYDAIKKDSQKQFGQKPWRFLEAQGVIVYQLSEDIIATIQVFPNGTYTVGTGLKKNFKLQGVKDA